MQTNGLTAKIEILRNSPLFINPSDDYAMNEKQQILLVLTGHKPVSEVASGHWEPTETGRQTVPDDSTKVSELLESLGLAYHLRPSEHALDVTVSLDPALVTEYEQADEATNVGRLFGYPETAIAAYGTDDIMPIDEQDKITEEAGLGDWSPFRFSRDHWQDELALTQEWYGVIQQYGFEDSPAD